MIKANFTAVKVTTAADHESIRQIGISKWVDSRPSQKHAFSVNPEGEDDVHSFKAIASHISGLLNGEILVTYGMETRLVLEAAFEEAGQDLSDAKWVDCSNVARAAWPKEDIDELELSDLCDLIGVRYEANEDLGDAPVIGEVFLSAIRASGF